MLTGHRSADFEDSLMNSFATFPASNFNPYERLVLFMAHQGKLTLGSFTLYICLPGLLVSETDCTLI